MKLDIDVDLAFLLQGPPIIFGSRSTNLAYEHLSYPSSLEHPYYMTTSPLKL